MDRNREVTAFEREAKRPKTKRANAKNKSGDRKKQPAKIFRRVVAVY